MKQVICTLIGSISVIIAAFVLAGGRYQVTSATTTARLDRFTGDVVYCHSNDDCAQGTRTSRNPPPTPSEPTSTNSADDPWATVNHPSG